MPFLTVREMFGGQLHKFVLASSLQKSVHSGKKGGGLGKYRTYLVKNVEREVKLLQAYIRSFCFLMYKRCCLPKHVVYQIMCGCFFILFFC
jgi:hypothetical protein